MIKFKEYLTEAKDFIKEFEKLTGIRQRALERPLKKIEALKENEHMVETKTGAPLKIIENPDIDAMN